MYIGLLYIYASGSIVQTQDASNTAVSIESPLYKNSKGFNLNFLTVPGGITDPVYNSSLNHVRIEVFFSTMSPGFSGATATGTLRTIIPWEWFDLSERCLHVSLEVLRPKLRLMEV